MLATGVSSVASATSLALPGVWRADGWASDRGTWLASGHAALDAELPGGGWPTGELIELLQPPAAQHEWRLLLPALRRLPHHGPLVLVGAPHRPHLAAWAAQGVAPDRVLWVDTADANERLWAAEQVLRSGTAGALLVWLPQARPEQLRRLHLAARGATTASPEHAGPLLFALRPEAQRPQASPAPLRLWLGSAQGRLQVQVFKRRGPPMDQPLNLAAELPVMACLRRFLPAQALPVSAPMPVTLPSSLPEFLTAPTHVVDRSVAHPRYAFA